MYNLCLHVFLFNAPHHVATHFLCIMFSYSTKRRLREYLQQQKVQMDKKKIGHFPVMSDSVMDTLLDLVEDDEAVVRTVMLYII